MAVHGHRLRDWAARHDIALYLGLAYVISWSIWPLVLLNPESSPLVPFGPGLAAVLVAFLVGGRPELLGLLRQFGRWRANPAWYGVALGMPLVAPGLALWAAVAAGAPVPRWEPADLLQVAGSIVVTVFIVGIFEELGWRGFLLPRLQRDYSALRAALIIGLAWFPWHLPELVSDPGQRPLTPFAVYILAQSVLLAWLYNSTQACLPVVVLFHAAFNSFTKFFLADLQGSPYPYLVAWCVLAGVVAVLAVAAVVYAGSRDLVKGGLRPAH